MSFTSLQYFFFVPIVFLIFCWLGEKKRTWWLLVASFGFYAALASYLPFVLTVVIILTWFCGRAMGQASDERRKQFFLRLGVGGNILILTGMKYIPFLVDNINWLATHLGVAAALPAMPVLVSIGVSFFVFQAIGYLLDLSLDLQDPERDFGIFALSLAFFPKLLQGPIERTREIVPQLVQRYEFDYQMARSGILLFAWGLFQKAVVADRLSSYVDTVYNNVHGFQGAPLILATYLYAFQIYFEFSGYTCMALGTARLFNIRLTQNFNSPYMALSIADFWRRWHISFSRWILDYLFKPLQMRWRRWGNRGTALALMVTFLVSGVWHGASWGFVVWGLLHGCYLSASVFWKPYQKRIHKIINFKKNQLLKVWQVVVTFNLVCVAWVFFRANNLDDAWYILRNCLAPARGLSSSLSVNGPMELAIAMSSLLVPLLVKLLAAGKGMDGYFARPLVVRWTGYCLLLLVILFFGAGGNRAFVYYRF
jgi:D-alanyl-lipoteichoic acid acyltransferase DltB (MBOAT superfamily)